MVSELRSLGAGAPLPVVEPTFLFLSEAVIASFLSEPRPAHLQKIFDLRGCEADLIQAPIPLARTFFASARVGSSGRLISQFLQDRRTRPSGLIILLAKIDKKG